MPIGDQQNLNLTQAYGWCGVCGQSWNGYHSCPVSEQIIRERELITTINLLTKAIEVLTERLAEVSELKKLAEADRRGR